MGVRVYVDMDDIVDSMDQFEMIELMERLYNDELTFNRRIEFLSNIKGTSTSLTQSGTKKDFINYINALEHFDKVEAFKLMYENSIDKEELLSVIGIKL